jgi:hypothetical protein
MREVSFSVIGRSGLPTRKELAQTALLATLTASAPVLAGMQALFRCWTRTSAARGTER